MAKRGNPYHDRSGKFASGPSSGGKSAKQRRIRKQETTGQKFVRVSKSVASGTAQVAGAVGSAFLKHAVDTAIPLAAAITVGAIAERVGAARARKHSGVGSFGSPVGPRRFPVTGPRIANAPFVKKNG